MRIGYLLRPQALTCRPEERLLAVARRMRAQDVSALAVCTGDRLVGLLTHRDLARAVADGTNPPDAPVRTYAGPVGLTAGPQETTREVAGRMLECGIDHVVVVDGGRVVNVVSLRHVLAAQPDLLDPPDPAPAPRRTVEHVGDAGWWLDRTRPDCLPGTPTPQLAGPVSVSTHRAGYKTLATALAGRCGYTHLPTGRVCPLPARHAGPCTFGQPLPSRAPAAADPFSSRGASR